MIVIVTFCMMCAACQRNNPNVSETNDILYTTGTGYDENWEETFGVYNGDAIPNKECAISVATAILDAMHDGDLKHVPIMVFYDEDAEVWVVHFAREQTSDGYIIGDEYSITLQQKDGKVLRIQFHE